MRYLRQSRENIYNVPIRQQKGDSFEFANYRRMKLMECKVKILERVLAEWLRKEMEIDGTQFRVMKGRGKTDAIFMMRKQVDKTVS